MFPLIPRVRVNYTFDQLFKALWFGGKPSKNYFALQNELCSLFGVDKVLLTSSGRASIYMVLNALPQKKVIVPAYTCKVVVEAALIAGKDVRYAKTSRETFNCSSFPNLDNDTIVIATHQYGIPCEIEYIASQCASAGAVLIEDCAASLGSKYNGKLTGTFGDYSIFSFDSSKMMTVPSKGGFIIARDSSKIEVIEEKTPLLQCNAIYKIKHLCRGFIYLVLKNKMIYRCFHYITMQRKGQMQLEDHSELDLRKGEFYTHGLYEWQAAIALPQVKKLSSIIERRQYIYKYYNEHIDNPNIQKPVSVEDSACIRYAILVKDKKRFYEKCLKRGVDMGFSFNSVVCPSSFAKEHRMTDEVLNLPYYYDMTDKEMKRVVDVVNSIR